MIHGQVGRATLKQRYARVSVKLSLISGVALMPLCASAQDATWTGGTSSDYDTATNWNTGTVPNGGQNVIFGGGAATTDVTVSTPYPAGVFTVGSVTFADTAGTYGIAISNTAYLHVNGNIVNDSDVTQSFSVVGSAATGAASGLYLTGDAGSNIVYTSGSYGQIVFSGAAVSGANATFVLDGGALDYQGSGTLTLGEISGSGPIAYYGSGSSTGTIQIGALDTDSTLNAQIQEQSGALVIEKIGTGTLTLTGPSTYTGGTIVSEGTLLVSNDDAIGSGGLQLDGGTTFGTSGGAAVTLKNAVTLGGGSETIATSGGDLTLAGDIGETEGSAALTKAGTGTLILTGTGSYTGGTTIAAGTLQLGDGGATGSITGDVADNGTLDFDRSDDVAFAGTISGTGGVGQIGTGTLTLAGENTFTGAVTIAQGGTLALADTGSIADAIGVEAGGTFDLADAAPTVSVHSLSGQGSVLLGGNTLSLTQASGTFSGVVSGEGGLTVSGGHEVLTGANTYTGTTGIGAEATLQLGDGGATGSIAGDVADDGTLAFDRSDSSTFAGVISGTGAVEQIGSGETILSGDSSGFAGTTEVVNGTLTVSGALGGSIAVDEGGTLAGTGSLGGITVASGGVVSPGGAGTIGTLSVNGDLTLAADSTYVVDANAAGQSDLIHATGTAGIAGSEVSVLASGQPWLVSTRYTILTADGGVTGTVSSVKTDFAFLTPTVSYDEDDVYLELVRNDVNFADVAVTPNEVAAANALTSLDGGTLPNALILLSTAEAPVAFNQLTGEIHASLKSVLIDDSRYVRDAAIDRVRAVFSQAGTSSGATRTHGLALWSQGYGSWGHYDGNGNAAHTGHNTGGFLVGADAALFGGWKAGVLGGYSRTTIDGNGGARSDNYSVGAYGGNQWGALGLRLGVTNTWHDIVTSRAVDFTGFSDSLSARYHGRTLQGFGDLGLKLALGKTVAVEPFVSGAYVDLRTTRFIEDGGAAALVGQRDGLHQVFSTAGLRLSGGLSGGAFSLSVFGSAGWRHAYQGVTPTSTMRFDGSDAFTVSGVPIARNAAAAEAGISSAMSQHLSLSVSYIGQFGIGQGKGTQDQGVRGSVSWRF